MVAEGQIYNCVHFAGTLEITEILESKNELKVKLVENDGRTTQDKIGKQQFLWAIDRGDYVSQVRIPKTERWKLEGIKKVLNENFGLHNALNSLDTYRIQAGVQTLRQKTGYQQKYIYSIIDTIRNL